MFQIFAKKRVAIPVAVVTALAIGGVAFAYWTTGGTGTGSGTTGTSVDLTVAQTSTVEDMVPGSAVQDLDFSITNSEATPQYVTSVTITITGITYIDAAGFGIGGDDNDDGTTPDQSFENHAAGFNAVTAGCANTSGPVNIGAGEAENFTLVQPGKGASADTLFGFDVPGSATAGGVTNYTQIANLNTSKGGRLSMNNLVTNQDECKGTTVALLYTLV